MPIAREIMKMSDDHNDESLHLSMLAERNEAIGARERAEERGREIEGELRKVRLALEKEASGRRAAEQHATLWKSRAVVLERELREAQASKVRWGILGALGGIVGRGMMDD